MQVHFSARQTMLIRLSRKRRCRQVLRRFQPLLSSLLSSIINASCSNPMSSRVNLILYYYVPTDFPELTHVIVSVLNPQAVTTYLMEFLLRSHGFTTYSHIDPLICIYHQVRLDRRAA